MKDLKATVFGDLIAIYALQARTLEYIPSLFEKMERKLNTI
jgi:hypothetical protein